jgi:hypothetical protein
MVPSHALVSRKGAAKRRWRGARRPVMQPRNRRPSPWCVAARGEHRDREHGQAQRRQDSGPAAPDGPNRRVEQSDGQRAAQRFWKVEHERVEAADLGREPLQPEVGRRLVGAHGGRPNRSHRRRGSLGRLGIRIGVRLRRHPLSRRGADVETPRLPHGPDAEAAGSRPDRAPGPLRLGPSHVVREGRVRYAR